MSIHVRKIEREGGVGRGADGKRLRCKWGYARMGDVGTVELEGRGCTHGAG